MDFKRFPGASLCISQIFEEPLLDNSLLRNSFFLSPWYQKKILTSKVLKVSQTY